MRTSIVAFALGSLLVSSAAAAQPKEGGAPPRGERRGGDPAGHDERGEAKKQDDEKPREGRRGRRRHHADDARGEGSRPHARGREDDDDDDDDDDDRDPRRGRRRPPRPSPYGWGGPWGHPAPPHHGGYGPPHHGGYGPPYHGGYGPPHHGPPWGPQGHHPPAPPSATHGWGGLGYFSVGFMHGSFRFLDDALRDPGGLGQGYARSDTALAFGGGGGALIGHRLWLGGKGFGFVLPTESSDRGSARVRGGGGGFELGVAALNRPRALVIPYLGLGGMGTSVDVRNRSATPVSVGAIAIAPGESRTFDAGVWTVDAGVRAFGLYFPGNGGFTAGLDLGFMTSLAPSSFETSGATLGSVTPARLSAGYLRLVFGGGGFFASGR